MLTQPFSFASRLVLLMLPLTDREKRRKVTNVLFINKPSFSSLCFEGEKWFFFSFPKAASKKTYYPCLALKLECPSY